MKKDKEIYYSIFDINNYSMLAENAEVKGKNTADALRNYLKDKTIKFKRSSHKQCEYCVTAQFKEDGRVYKYGNRVWYKLF